MFRNERIPLRTRQKKTSKSQKEQDESSNKASTAPSTFTAPAPSGSVTMGSSTSSTVTPSTASAFASTSAMATHPSVMAPSASMSAQDSRSAISESHSATSSAPVPSTSSNASRKRQRSESRQPARRQTARGTLTLRQSLDDPDHDASDGDDVQARNDSDDEYVPSTTTNETRRSTRARKPSNKASSDAPAPKRARQKAPVQTSASMVSSNSPAKEGPSQRDEDERDCFRCGSYKRPFHPYQNDAPGTNVLLAAYIWPGDFAASSGMLANVDALFCWLDGLKRSAGMPFGSSIVRNCPLRLPSKS